MRIEEFEPEKKWWKKRKETEQAWKVSAKDIAERGYNLDIKNPNAIDDAHVDPDELLAGYMKMMKEIGALQDELKKELMAALDGKKGKK